MRGEKLLAYIPSSHSGSKLLDLLTILAIQRNSPSQANNQEARSGDLNSPSTKNRPWHHTIQNIHLDATQRQDMGQVRPK